MPRETGLADRVLDALRKHESTTGSLNGLSAVVLRQHFLHSLTEMQVRKTLERLRRRGKVLAVGTRQDRKYCTKQEALKPPQDEQELTWLCNAVEEFFRSVRPVGIWLDTGKIAEGIIVPPGRVLDRAFVMAACARLIAAGKLRVLEGLYSMPMVGVGGPDAAVKGQKQKWFTIQPLEDFVRACSEALDPDGREEQEQLSRAVIPGRIAQLRTDLETANKLLSAERELRHKGAQTLADEKAKWELEAKDLLADYTKKEAEMLHARARSEALECQLDTHEAKLSALDACYRGLFGERKS